MDIGQVLHYNRQLHFSSLIMEYNFGYLWVVELFYIIFFMLVSKTMPLDRVKNVKFFSLTHIADNSYFT